MLRAHLKLIAAFLVLGIVAAAAVGMYYAWENYVEPSYQARREILDLEREPPKRIDVGKREFGEAMGMIAQGDVVGAHKQLSMLVSTYSDSAAFSESRRILGEVNMDRLLSSMRTPGKLEYEVKGGDSLIKIAAQHNSTVDYIVQVNDLQGHLLHRGEQLLVSPLEFSMNVSLSEKTVTLLKDGKFFKEYRIRLSRGVRPADTEIESRSAFVDNRAVRLGKPGYIGSEKWLSCKKPVPFGPYTKETREDEDLQGIFLDVADMEELYTVLRYGTPVRIRK